ncbi:MAG: cyclic nucleotide-binding domain-containing protein [Anaerolineae bacterium]|nr:cyclic nucleotide-binding domain-containing protein [Anaerolineae bacterium]
MELLAILKTAELFQGLKTEQLSRIVGLANQETYNAEEYIFSQGETGDKLYIIGSGQVEIRVSGSQGDSFTALYLGQGQLFGEMALLDQGRRSASVVAVQDETVVYSISSDEFNGLCRVDTAIGYTIMRNMALDLSFKLRHRNFDPSAG